MPDLMSGAVRALVVTNNMLEGDDLRELLDLHQFGPSLHVRKVETALELVANATEELRLLIVGLNAELDRFADLVGLASEKRLSLLFIDAPPQEAERERASFVARPYTSGDVLNALSRLKSTI